MEIITSSPIFLNVCSEQHQLVMDFYERFSWNILFRLCYRTTGACMFNMGGPCRIRPLTLAYSI